RHDSHHESLVVTKTHGDQWLQAGPDFHLSDHLTMGACHGSSFPTTSHPMAC
ncbi:hypothetical protein HAX54_023264, partial [Datura stramonium]|nr:hypothetical protein [Datura stramonium]